MKLLITGGCGFLGSNLVAQALKSGYELVVFDNLHRVGSQENLRWLQTLGKFRFVCGDIRNNDDVVALMRELKPQTVFHLAGQVAMTTSIDNPRLDFEVNALGTLNLLEAVRAYAPAATLIYSSTNKVYGDLEQYHYTETDTRYICLEKPHGFDEDTPIRFHSPYGCSKGAADQYVLDYARIFGLNTIVFRHSSMYGGRQFATHDQGWVGWFCQKAIETKKGVLKEPFTLSGTGMQVRDVLHADDMTRLYFLASEKADHLRGQVFNIGGGIANSLSLIELFAILEEITDTKLLYINLPPRQSDQLVFIADISKAKRLLGWEPMISVRQGVTQMIEWVGALCA